MRVGRVQETIVKAIDLHRRGQITGAKRLYRQILMSEPQHFDALQLLGVIHLQAVELEESINLIGRAVSIKSDYANAYANLGNAFLQLNRLRDSRACYLKAAALNPHDAELYCNIGRTFWASGNAAAAVASYDRACAIRPDYAEAYSGRGIVFQKTKKFTEAMASYDKGIAVKPDHAGLHGNRGVLLQELNALDAAVVSYDRAIAIEPGQAIVYSNRGNTLSALKDWRAAIASFDRALALSPDYAEAHYNRGVALQERKMMRQAATSYGRAIHLNPGYAEAYCNCGSTMKELRQSDAVIVHYRKAIVLRPDYAEALYNQGNVLQEFMRPGPAITCYDRAIAIWPGNAEACLNRGNAFMQRKQLDKAIASYDQAISVQPDCADAYWNKSHALLLSGNFAQGWRLYEWRWRTAKTELKQRFPGQPPWLGAESVAGKRVFLHSEQGLGDTLQFCRYAMLVQDLGAYVILEVQQPLFTLLKGLAGVDHLVAQGETVPAFDFHCPLQSLPLAFETDLTSIPSPQQYLRCDEANKVEWEKLLGARTGLRVGLAWSGSSANKGDHIRSIALERLLAHLPETLHYFSLQKDVRDSEIELLRSTPRIRHFGDRIRDFSDTAALCDLMDVVICVDTSVAHLSGALGTMTWLLLPVVPDWRWLLSRSDSPWYDSMRLYRQDQALDWDGVIERVRDDLISLDRVVGVAPVNAQTTPVRR